MSACLSLKRCAHGNPPLAEMLADRSPPSDSLLDNFWTPINHYDGRQVAHALGRFWPDRIAMRDRLVQPQRQGTVSLRLINGAACPLSVKHMVDRVLESMPEADIVSIERWNTGRSLRRSRQLRGRSGNPSTFTQWPAMQMWIS